MGMRNEMWITPLIIIVRCLRLNLLVGWVDIGILTSSRCISQQDSSCLRYLIDTSRTDNRVSSEAGTGTFHALRVGG